MSLEHDKLVPAPLDTQITQSAVVMQGDGDERLLPPVLVQYWHTVLRWRWVLAGIIGASLVLGLVATLLMPSLYTAKSEIEISRQQKKVTNVEGLDAVSSGQDLEFYATQYALLKAVSLAQRVSKTLKLASNEEFFAAHGKKPAANPAARERQAVGMLLGNISIDPIRTSRLVDIQYTSRSPALSAQIANTWTQAFIGANMDREFASTADARRFLEERLNVLRAKVEESERDVVTYATANNIVTLDSVIDASGKTQTQRTLASSDLEALNQALMTARADRITAQSKLAGGGTSSPEVLSDSVIASLRPKRAEVAADYANILTRFEPGYPAAKALKNQLDSIDAAIARQAANVSGSTRQAYIQAVAREHDLEARVAALKLQLDNQRRSSIQYNIYQREADTNRQLYDALLQRYKEIGVAGTVGASNIVIVDKAETPTIPSAPKLPVNLALALLIGLGLAAVTVLALEQIDEGIRGPNDVGNLLKLPLLGNVPLDSEDLSLALIDPKSRLSEAYFSIRSTLAFATNRGLPRSLAVTSTQPGEGKSTTSFALATIIGRTGKHVLLIDGDMRSPSVHELAGSQNKAGLSNMLAGDNDFDKFILPTDNRGLFVLPAGPQPPSPAELLSSDRLSEILAILLQRFDHVIIDTPPILGLADAPLLCRAVEGCIFVIEPGKAAVRNIRSALHRLRQVGSHVFGAVIEKIDISRQHYGYSYGYGYGYGYGSSYGEQGEPGKEASAAS